MKRPHVIAGAVVAVLLAGGGAAYYRADDGDRAPASATTASSAKPSSPPTSRSRRARGGERHKPSGQVDIARVEAALARMKETTAKISREQIIAEQQKMLEAKAKFEAIQVAPPERRISTDEHGIRWAELTYPSGEVRYELAPDDEAPQSEPARAP